MFYVNATENFRVKTLHDFQVYAWVDDDRKTIFLVFLNFRFTKSLATDV